MRTPMKSSSMRAALAGAALLAPAIGVVSVGSSAEAASGTAMVDMNIRESPSTGAKVVGSFKKGAKVTFPCYKNGTTVTGTYGPSKIWLSVDGNQKKWVSEALVYTGTNAPTVPVCGATSTSTLSQKVDAFVAKYNGKYADFDGYYGAQCVDLSNFWVRDVIKARVPSVSYAYQLYDTYDSSKFTRIASSSAPAKGDLAIWNHGGSYGSTGHVALVLGTSGSNLKVLTQNPGTTKVSYISKTNLRGYLRPR